MKVRLSKTYDFEAAHIHLLERTGQPGAHGHRFYVHVSQAGEVDPQYGWLVDFGVMSQIVKPVVDELDHRCLNEIPGIPHGSTEEIADWVLARVSGQLPFPATVHVKCRDAQRPETLTQPPNPGLDLPERLGLAFEAAHFLPEVPAWHKCRRLHGHSYAVSVLGADAGMESLMKFYAHLHERLDHSLLNELPGLSNPTAELLAQWIWREADKFSLNHSRVAIEETCESGCVYEGD